MEADDLEVAARVARPAVRTAPELRRVSGRKVGAFSVERVSDDARVDLGDGVIDPCGSHFVGHPQTTQIVGVVGVVGCPHFGQRIEAADELSMRQAPADVVAKFFA